MRLREEPIDTLPSLRSWLTSAMKRLACCQVSSIWIIHAAARAQKKIPSSTGSLLTIEVEAGSRRLVVTDEDVDDPTPERPEDAERLLAAGGDADHGRDGPE